MLKLLKPEFLFHLDPLRTTVNQDIKSKSLLPSEKTGFENRKCSPSSSLTFSSVFLYVLAILGTSLF